MYAFDLMQTANQMFNTNINDHNFEFRFRTFRDLLYCSVKVDGVDECASVRATPNRSIFPKFVNDMAGGVFMFSCTTDDYPHYNNFDGVSCRFVFIPYEELK